MNIIMRWEMNDEWWILLWDGRWILLWNERSMKRDDKYYEINNERIMKKRWKMEKSYCEKDIPMWIKITWIILHNLWLDDLLWGGISWQMISWMI